MIRMIIKDAKFECILEDITSIELDIENKKHYYDFIVDLQNSFSEINTIKLFDENNKELKNSDYFDVIPSLFSIDINNKRNINALLKYLKLSNKDCLNSFINNIKEELVQLSNTLNLESPIEFGTNLQIAEDDILKLLDIYIKVNNRSLISMLLSYIKTSYELRKIRIFVIANMGDFFEQHEIELLLHDSELMNIKIINIESKQTNFTCFGKKIILDKDFCILD